MPGQMQLIGFVDTGSGTIYRNPWMTGDNRSTVSGAGVGLNWYDYNNFSVNMYWAHKLGNTVLNPVTDSSGRFWIQVVKYF
jgi:hemolysin activation/secretion protein